MDELGRIELKASWKPGVGQLNRENIFPFQKKCVPSSYS